MARPPRPCIERLGPHGTGVGCPEYALPGKHRCAEHQREAIKSKKIDNGTTTAWRKARKIALERSGYTCERCGRTDKHSRDLGLGGLHVHHTDGRGVRADEHPQELLKVLCAPCHKKVGRPTLDQWKAQLKARPKPWDW